MSHPNARLTLRGRQLIVERARAGWTQAHIAAAMGISRRCVRRWLERYAAAGEAGLHDRSSRPHGSPRRVAPAVEDAVLALRGHERLGRDVIAHRLGVAPRTVSRILARHGVPHLSRLDPITGQLLRASKATAIRYERARPGELVHMDVKKLGRIPDGGGWRAHGRASDSIRRDRTARVGFDYVHSLVDDHSRLAYSEVLPDERGATCAAFLERAIGYFAGHGISASSGCSRTMPGPTATRCDRSCAAHRHQPAVHQAALPLAERQGRALQPHAADRVGLSAGLPQQ